MKTTTLKYADSGSISHGTLREADLLSTFISELEGAMLLNGVYFSLPENFNERDCLCDLIGEAQDCFSDDGKDIREDKLDETNEVLSCLFEALDMFSPSGHSFGAHEGDGSDFGYWPNVEQD